MNGIVSVSLNVKWSFSARILFHTALHPSCGGSLVLGKFFLMTRSPSSFPADCVEKGAGPVDGIQRYKNCILYTIKLTFVCVRRREARTHQVFLVSERRGLSRTPQECSAAQTKVGFDKKIHLVRKNKKEGLKGDVGGENSLHKK